jgi:hypothetical protein
LSIGKEIQGEKVMNFRSEKKRASGQLAVVPTWFLMGCKEKSSTNWLETEFKYCYDSLPGDQMAR